MKTIALIDDDKSTRERFSAYLRQMGYDCVAYDNPVTFTEDLKQSQYPFELAITDINMPEISGMDLLLWLKCYYPNVFTIALTAHNAQNIESIAYEKGACLFLKKPLKLEYLHRTIRLLSQQGLSGEVFHVTLLDCLQILAYDGEARVLKIQEDGRSHLLVALQHNQVQGITYIRGKEQLQGNDALTQLICIGNATFSELKAERYAALISQALHIPLSELALHIAQYQNESSMHLIKAQTLGISAPASQKQLLSQSLTNIGFEVSEEPAACHAHIVMKAMPDTLEKMNAYPKPTLVAKKEMPLLRSFLNAKSLASVQTQALENVGEWANYIKSHFIRGLSGTLNKISVFQLIQLVSRASTTGCIQIKDMVKQRESTLYFVKGKLVEVRLNKELGKSAFLESMRIRMGCFEQTPFQEPPSRQLEHYPVMRLLMSDSRLFGLQDTFIQKMDP